MKTLQHDAIWDAIIKRLRALLAEKGTTQAQLAERMSVDRATITRWLKGERRASQAKVDVLVGYMKALGMDPAEFFGGESAADDDEYSKVPWLEATASMGGGSVETSKEEVAHLAFRTDWLRSKGRLTGMVVVNASGDSMSPTIPDRAVVLVNEQDKTPVNSGIFFVCHGDAIFLKRLRVNTLGRVTHLISDIDNWEMPLEPEVHFEIIGRAIWYGKEL